MSCKKSTGTSAHAFAMKNGPSQSPTYFRGIKQTKNQRAESRSIYLVISLSWRAYESTIYTNPTSFSLNSQSRVALASSDASVLILLSLN
jgi:ribonuclease HI